MFSNSFIDYNVSKLKSPYILSNKNTNFNKNGTESKMENPTYSFRETNIVLQLIRESQIKSKKKKEGFFLPFILSEETFFNICVLEDELFTRYSFLVTFYSLLVTTYSFLVTFYLLLLTFHSFTRH